MSTTTVHGSSVNLATSSSATTSGKGLLRKSSTATVKAQSIRRNPSIRELRHLIFHKIPDKIFKKSNQSESFLPSTNTITTTTTETIPAIPSVDPVVIPTTVPQDQKFSFDMKRTRPTTSTAATNSKEKPVREARVSKDGIEWSPQLSEISFSPTLSVDISPLSPPNSPPPSRSSNITTFRRNFSLRNVLPNPRHSQILTQPPSLSQRHERRRSKYLNDPSVLSLLDRKFEEALELGFTSPPPTPHRTPSPVHSQSLHTPTTLVSNFDEGTIVEEEEEDIFSRPSPDLKLPTLKELEDGEGGVGDGMTLRLTLTPANCLTEVEEDLEVIERPGLGKRMSGLGRILRTRSRKVKI